MADPIWKCILSSGRPPSSPTTGIAAAHVGPQEVCRRARPPDSLPTCGRRGSGALILYGRGARRGRPRPRPWNSDPTGGHDGATRCHGRPTAGDGPAADRRRSSAHGGGRPTWSGSRSQPCPAAERTGVCSGRGTSRRGTCRRACARTHRDHLHAADSRKGLRAPIPGDQCALRRSAGRHGRERPDECRDPGPPEWLGRPRSRGYETP